MIYTVLRLALFVAVYVVLLTVGVLLWGGDNQLWLWTLIFAALISSALSVKLLEGPRERFAQQIEARAGRASARFEQMRAKEDVDDEPGDEPGDGPGQDEPGRTEG